MVSQVSQVSLLAPKHSLQIPSRSLFLGRLKRVTYLLRKEVR